MRLTAYAYPWDVASVGADEVVAELAEHGFDAIDLSASYHPVDAVSPRGGKTRLFVSPRGAVYFPARAQRYARIQPYVWPDERVVSAWPALAAATANAGLGLNGWAVVLYQPWLIDAYPDCARTLPSGERTGAGACPASPDVQEYAALLGEDLVDQFGVDVLRIEGAAMPEFDYGWLRPQLLFAISPVARQLLGLCFCASCASRAVAAGLDVERLRSLVTTAIAVEFEEATAAHDVPERFAYLTEDPELREFVIQHERAGAKLIRSVRARLKNPGVAISVRPPRLVSPLFGAERAAAYRELLREVDEVVLLPQVHPDTTRDVHAATTASGQQVKISALLVGPVDMSFLNPADRGPDLAGDGCRAEVQAALDASATEISVYNYGLLHGRDVARVASTLADVVS